MSGGESGGGEIHRLPERPSDAQPTTTSRVLIIVVSILVLIAFTWWISDGFGPAECAMTSDGTREMLTDEQMEMRNETIDLAIEAFRSFGDRNFVTFDVIVILETLKVHREPRDPRSVHP